MRRWLFWLLVVLGAIGTVPIVARYFEKPGLEGIWKGTLAYAAIQPVPDEKCRPNWGEQVGHRSRTIYSFRQFGDTLTASTADLDRWDVSSYHVTVNGPAITLDNLVRFAHTASESATCELTLESETVNGRLSGDSITGVATQVWRLTNPATQAVTLRYDLTLSRVKP